MLDARLARAVRAFATIPPMSEMIEHVVTVARRGTHPATRVAVLVAQAEGAEAADALDAAAAIELLVAYISLHDELAASLERNGPLAIARETVAQTINTGDGICSMSFLTLYANEAGVPAERIVGIARALYQANLQLTAGQGRMLALAHAQSVSIDDYELTVDEKSAVLFAAAARMGALLAGASEERAKAWSTLARAATLGAALGAYGPIARRIPEAERNAAEERHRNDALAIATTHAIDRESAVRDAIATSVRDAAKRALRVQPI